MPVEGLPPAVDTVINDLILTGGLISYKIAGNPSVTTVVLRFGAMAGHGVATDLAESRFAKGSMRAPIPKYGTWNRKSSSKFTRDRQRQEQFIPKTTRKSTLSEADTFNLTRYPRKACFEPAITDPISADTINTIQNNHTEYNRAHTFPCVSFLSDTTQRDDEDSPKSAGHINSTPRYENTHTYNNNSVSTNLSTDSGCLETTELHQTDLPYHHTLQDKQQNDMISPRTTASGLLRSVAVTPSTVSHRARESSQCSSNTSDRDFKYMPSYLNDTDCINSQSQPGVSSTPFGSITRKGKISDHLLSADTVNTKPRGENSKACYTELDGMISEDKTPGDNDKTCNFSVPEDDKTCGQNQMNSKQQNNQHEQQQQKDGKEQQTNTGTHVTESSHNTENVTSLPRTSLRQDRNSFPNFEKFMLVNDGDKLQRFVSDLNPVSKAKLMDWNRNSNFTKVAIRSFEDARILIAGTDDLEIACDLDNYKQDQCLAVKAGFKFRDVPVSTVELKLFETIDIDDPDGQALVLARSVLYILKLVNKYADLTE